MSFIKGLLQSEQLKYHMVFFDVDQSLSKSTLYEHICLENIKKLCKLAAKYDDQQYYKVIIEVVMVSTP